MPLFMILLFSIAISIDGTAVGITYGLKDVRIPLASMSIIGLASAFAVAVSVSFGNALGGVMNPIYARILGGAILILLGLLRCKESLRNTKPDCVNPDVGLLEDAGEILTLRLRFIGIVIHVLRDPESADVDRSGFINMQESFLLGAALALDAIGAGLAAGSSSFPPIATGIISGALSALFLSAGIRLGSCAHGVINGRLRMVPGLVLVLLGLVRTVR